MLKIIILASGGIVLFFLILSCVICRKMAKADKKDTFQFYWDTLNDDQRTCPNALEYWKNGVAIHKKYKIPFPEIGCANETEFHRAAVDNLERTLAGMYENATADSVKDPSFNSMALSIRADLAKLMLAVLDEEGKKKLANKFVTA